MTNLTELPKEHSAALSAVANSQTAQAKDVRRAVIILTYTQTGNVSEAARRAGVCPNTARMWIGRYDRSGVDGLEDLDRSGSPKTHGPEVVLALTAAATSTPPRPHTVWTFELLAQHLNVSGYRVCPDWCRTTLATLDVNPTKTTGWLNRPTNPEALAEFGKRAEKVCDVLNAGVKPSVVRVALDEKTAIAARERTRADLPPAPGLLARREFEYVRHGVVNVQGAYNHDTGELLHRFTDSNNTEAFIVFVEQLLNMWAPDPNVVVELILDNGSSHTSKRAREFLTNHPQIRVVYTPVHASWLNLAELMFSALQRQVLTHGSWTSGQHLEAAISSWYGYKNKDPVPVQWTYQWEPKNYAETYK